MSRATLESAMRDHPKWLALSPLAYRLGVRLVLWANQHSKSAFVPEFVVKEYAGTTTMARKLARELVECGARFGKSGVLETCEGGYIVHDLLTEAELEATGAAHQGPVRPLSKSEAGRLGGQRSVEARRAASGSASPKQEPVLRSSNAEANPGASGSASASTGQAGPDLTYQDDSGSSSKTPSSSKSDRVGARAEPPAEAPQPASKARPKLWKKIPADWVPKEEHREICLARGVDFELETAKLRDHEFNPKREDADGVARNWYRNARPTRDPVIRQPSLVDAPRSALTQEQIAARDRRLADNAEIVRRTHEELAKAVPGG
jgi:hypothetical protein